MVESNTVLGSGLRSLCTKWVHSSSVAPGNTGADPLDSAESRPSHVGPISTPGELSAPSAASPASTDPFPAALRVPYSHDDVHHPPEQDESADAPQLKAMHAQRPLQPGRELRDITGVVDKLLLNREDLTAGSFMSGQERPQARRLVLSIEAEQLPLQDERAAAQGYAALVAREEALAAAARAASRREIEALASAAAAEAEFEAARRDLARLHNVAEAMRVERYV